MDENFIGTISLLPNCWVDQYIKICGDRNYKCEGQSLPILENSAFFSLIMHKFDTVENPKSFSIPDLRNKAIDGYTYCINRHGYYPTKESNLPTPTSDYIGSVVLFPFDFEPIGFLLCDGRTLPIDGNATLFSIIGFQFGGDDKTKFCIPNLLGKSPIKNTQYYICNDGPHPLAIPGSSRDRENWQYAANIRLFAFKFMPYGYLACEGQILNVEDYGILFAKIGNHFGGDAINTFALPDLRKEEFSNLRFGICVFG